ncbi:MAG: monofunctional biosynthetic peptidoglycan transglycosylase [Gammaproteobacteria bacterium]
MLLVLTVLPVALLHIVDPPITAFMLAARVGAWRAGDAAFALDYRPLPLTRISPWAALAVIAAEDQRFAEHGGFDLAAIEDALTAHAGGARLRGASTLSQQVAKNLFLWPGRSWLRKGLEAGYTVLLELLLDKRRILELHLNIAEYGPGVYGVEAAAQRYFGRAAAALEPRQAALLATALPNPRQRRLAAPSAAMRARQAWILQQMDNLGGTNWLERLD